MSWVVPIRPAALLAWRRLQEALDDAGPTACRDRIEWISPDAASIEYAERRCAGCPVIRQCGDYADAGRERTGVWGGQSKTPRKGAAPSLPMFEDNEKDIA